MTSTVTLPPKVSLRQLYVGETIVLRAIDGTGTFAKSTRYAGYLDSDFQNWGLNVRGRAAPETPVEIYEMDEEGENGTFTDIFSSLGSDLEKLRIPQAQAESFAPDHKDKLHPEGWGTFLLFTKGDEPVNKDKSNLFVACVYAFVGELEASVFEFSLDFVWHAECGYRIVVPQQ